MTQPSVSTQGVQVGIEGTRGTPVACTKKLLSLGWDLQPEQVYDTFTPMGDKYPTLVTMHQDWSSGKLDGRMTYDEMIYPLGSVIGVPTRVLAGTTSSTWAFQSADAAPDTPLSFTAMEGSSLVGYGTPGLVVTELTLLVDRTAGATLTGTVLGENLVTPLTLTGSPTSISPITAIRPGDVSIFVDPSGGTLGSTQLTGVVIAEFKITNRWGPFWTVDATQTSYADIVELLPVVTFTLTMSANTTGWGFLNTAKLDDTVWISMVCTGPVITGDTPHYAFTLNMAGKINAVPAKGATADVETLAWQFVSVFDPIAFTGSGPGKSLDAFLTNGLASTALAADTATAFVA